MGGRTSGTRPKGSGIPASGAGWGGDAKGAGKPADALPPGSHTMSAKAAKDARAAEMEQVLYEIALSGEHESNRVNAAYKLKTLLDGLPVAKQVNINANAFDGISDEQLAAAIEEIRAAVAADSGGDGAGTGGQESQEPPGGVSPIH